jgi:hypothetical protein
MKFIIERKQFVNEGLFSWAGGLMKKGKIKKALKRYKNEYPEAKRKKLLKEFEIEVVKKNNPDANVSELQEELELLKDEEQTIKDELDLSIEQVIKKDPDMKLKAKKLQLAAKKDMAKTLRDMLSKLSKEDKYKEFNDVIKDRIKAVEDQNKKLDQGLASLKEEEKKQEEENKEGENKQEEENKEEGFQKVEDKSEINFDDLKGKQIQYKTNDGKTVKGEFIEKVGDDKVKIKGLDSGNEFEKSIDDVIGLPK